MYTMLLIQIALCLKGLYCLTCDYYHLFFSIIIADRLFITLTLKKEYDIPFLLVRNILYKCTQIMLLLFLVSKNFKIAKNLTMHQCYRDFSWNFSKKDIPIEIVMEHAFVTGPRIHATLIK